MAGVRWYHACLIWAGTEWKQAGVCQSLLHDSDAPTLMAHACPCTPQQVNNRQGPGHPSMMSSAGSASPCAHTCICMYWQGCWPLHASQSAYHRAGQPPSSAHQRGCAAAAQPHAAAAAAPAAALGAAPTAAGALPIAQRSAAAPASSHRQDVSCRCCAGSSSGIADVDQAGPNADRAACNHSTAAGIGARQGDTAACLQQPIQAQWPCW